MDLDFTINSLSGWVGVDEFTFTPIGTSINIPGAQFYWNFGDGTNTKIPSPSHLYNSPGHFPVTLTLKLPTQETGSICHSISAKYLFQEAIWFESTPPPTLAGHYNTFPFRVRITSRTNEPHWINLACLYSKSLSADLDLHKWDFLQSRWMFLDLNGNIINRIQTIDTPILGPNGNILGYTGTAEFFFIDDQPNWDLYLSDNLYTTLMVVLETSGTNSFNINHSLNEIPSLSNSTASVLLPYLVLSRIPETLNITENGIRPFISPKWINTPYPLFYTLGYGGNKQYTNSQTILVPYFSAAPFCHYYPGVSSSLKTSFLSAGLSSTSLSSLNASISAKVMSFGGVLSGQYCSSTSLNSLQVSASINFSVSSLSANWISPVAWVNNTANNSIANVGLIPLRLSAVDVTINTAQVGINYNNFGSYFAPLPFPDYGAWMIGSSGRYIQKIDSQGNLLSSIDLNQFGLYGLSAAQLGLDSNKNFWVSLYNSKSALKFSNQGSLLTTITANVISGSQVQDLVVDTFNNVWLAFKTPSAGTFFYFNSAGNLLTSFNTSLSTWPNKITVDGLNQMWCLLAGNGVGGNTLQQKTSSNNTHITVNLPTSGIGLTVDKNQSIWVSCANNQIISYSPIASSPINWTNAVSAGPLGFLLPHHLLSLSPIENKIYVFNINSPSATLVLETSFQPFISGINFYQNNKTNQWCYLSSIQLNTNGDWTGFLWNNKFNVTIPEYTASNQTITLSGISSIFNLLSANPYILFKKNENYDMAGNFQQLALLPSFQDSPNFFGKYLGGILGQQPLQAADLGVKVYEKISNFLDNNHNIDLCDISSIYSLSQMVGIVSDDYQLSYPLKIQRLMDLASISYNRLWGNQCHCKNIYNFNNINDICDLCGSYKPNNLGNIISITSTITGGSPIILKTKALNKFQVIDTGKINNALVYPLSTLASSLNLGTQWASYYEFYQFLPNSTNNMAGSVLDWLNTQTSLISSQSSLSAWVGTNQILDTIFTFELMNGMGFNN